MASESVTTTLSYQKIFSYHNWVPQWLSGEEFHCNAGAAGDTSLIPGWGRFPGGGQGNPLQCSCLENPMDGGAWWAAVHGVSKSRA